MSRYFLGALMAVLLFGCDPSRQYEEKIDFSTRHWLVKDTAKFDVVIANDTLRYNVKMDLRNSLDYPWARLFVQFELRDSAGRRVEYKLVPATLFDEKTGQPFGQSGIGDVFDHRVQLLDNYAFKYPGKYRIALVQMMRQDSLEGILSVGARVELANP